VGEADTKRIDMKIIVVIAIALFALLSSCVTIHNNNYPQQYTPQYIIPAEPEGSEHIGLKI